MRLRALARGRSALVVVTLATLGATTVATPAAAIKSPFDVDDVSPVVTVPPRALDVVADDPVDPATPGEWAPTARAPHVVVLGSGVDMGALPDTFGGSVTQANTFPDRIGYGTWVTAGILQIAPKAHVTSINLFPYGRLEASWVRYGLEWVAAHHTEGPTPVDAVVLAFPPTEYLDPVSVARDPKSASAYRDLLDTLLDRPVRSADGVDMGSVNDDYYRSERQLATASDPERGALRNYHDVVRDWRLAEAAVKALKGLGIPVVAPAGDLGPGLQTVDGLANLPDVVAVGAAATNDGLVSIAPASSTGPSTDGRVKPDLVAPVVTAGLVPADSVLAKLSGFGTTVPIWTSDVYATWADKSSVPRAWVASSLSAAALVVTGLAGLHAEGMRDVATMRGALVAAAEPLPGVAPWRQGAGVLTRTPDLAFAQSRPLVTSALNLGLSPAAGEWSASAPVSGGEAGVPVTSLGYFSGFGAHGETITTAIDAALAPSVTGTGGAALRAVATSGTAVPGLYCGYSEVPLPGGGAVTQVDEDVPICVVQGMRFFAESRYIHNEKAEDVTFELLPALPEPVGSLVERPFELMPLDPTHLPLYAAKVTEGGCIAKYGVGGYPVGLEPDKEHTKAADDETCAEFPSIPPGYYQTRLYSHYGAPVEWTTATGPKSQEIGAPVGYQKMPMWILPDDPDGPAGPLTQPLAPREADGSGKNWIDNGVLYRWEKATNTWLADKVKVKSDTPVPDETYDEVDLEVQTNLGLRFVYGHLKRIIGANVSSRVVDLLDYDSFARSNGFAALSLAELTGVDQLDDLPVSSDLSAWRWSRTPDAVDKTGFEATFNPLYTAAGKLPIGVARYPLDLTTPNYTMHASVNFQFEMTDAMLVVVLIAGDEWAIRKIEPKGDQVVSAPAGVQIPKNNEPPYGNVSGTASFDLSIKPKGLPRADLYFVTQPLVVQGGGKVAYTGASVKISGASVEYDTWTNAHWPQTGFCKDVPAVNAGDFCDEARTVKAQNLHVLPLAPNVNSREVDPATCRTITLTKVCEDWSLVVHAPSKDARLYDVRTGHPDPNNAKKIPSVDVAADLAAAGALRHDPAKEDKPPVTIQPVVNLSGVWPGTPAYRAAHPFHGLTNNRFWDSLVIPYAFGARYSNTLYFRIENDHGSDASFADGRRPIVARGAHRDVPVAPYVCYIPRAATVSPPLLPTATPSALPTGLP